jgi:hypothetical protein
VIINPYNWYWAVNGSTTEVYSSVSNTYVPVTDAAFSAWLRNNPYGAPKAASEAELWNVLTTSYGMPLADWLFNGATFVQPAAGQYTKAQLTGYAASKRYDVEVGGMTITGIPIATDRQSQAMINGAFNLASQNAALALQFKTESGFVSLTAAQIIGIAVAVATHVQNCFAKEAEVGAAIAAGSISDLAAIDAAFVGV